MEAIIVRHLGSEIFSQEFFAACHSSSEFLGLSARTPFFTSIQRCSIGMRSGDCAGQSLTLILCDRNHSFAFFECHYLVAKPIVTALLPQLSKYCEHNITVCCGARGSALASHTDVRRFDSRGADCLIFVSYICSYISPTLSNFRISFLCPSVKCSRLPILN